MARANLEQRLLFLLMQALVWSVLDYSLGLLTLSTTQITRFERIQNEGLRAVLGSPRDTPISSMQYLLDAPSIKIRHKYAQVRNYLKIARTITHPLHPEVSTIKGSRLKRGKSWMAEAETTIKSVCELAEVPLSNEWEEMSEEGKNLTKVIIQLSRECRNWA